MKKTKENKELLVKKYKDMFLVIYEIFGGVIVSNQLKKLCLKYSYFNCESTYYNTINLLESLDLVERTYLPGSDIEIIKIKQFVLNFLEGKRVRGIKFSKDKVLESTMKFGTIINSTKIKEHENATLKDFYDMLRKHTNFWSKEKSPFSVIEWIDSEYTLTKLGKESLEYAKEFEESRKSNLNSKEIDDKTTKTESLLEDYTTKISFGNIRNRRGYLNNLWSQNNVINISNFIISEDLVDYKSIAKFVFDSIYLSSQHIEGTQSLLVNFKFLSAQQRDSAFASCFEYSRDERGILKENKNLLNEINKYSKKYLNIPLKPHFEEINTEKHYVRLKYRLRFGGELYNIQDKEFEVLLLFSNSDVYNKLYGVKKSEAMILESKSRAKERKEERKKKDAVVSKIAKLEKQGHLDKLETLIKDLSYSEIEKLVSFIKNL